MHKPLTTILALLIATVSVAQNIVHNPGFELYSSCPTTLGDIDYCEDWNKPSNASTDYYNTCANGGMADVPDNYNGHQQPASGNAYTGLVTFADVVPDYREYLMGKLANMQAGQAYKVSIKVSLSGVHRYATDGIGVFFVVDSFYMSMGYMTTLPHTPQIDYSDYGPVTDTSSWITLTDTFYADSAYTRLVIGCFKPDSLLTVDTVSQLSWENSYYFIDDVSVEPVTLTVAVAAANEPANIYPNPLSGSSEVSFDNPGHADYSFTLYSMQGQLVHRISGIRSGNFTVSKGDMPAGLYYYRLATTGRNDVYTGKLVIE
ncbi:MAG TPA: T9SS type A sorting domain-containing protein [Flavipsychrobacter sp.]|nr:T9SS type A sorting domain-containing protein [Flavipsychrobacter sp.]